MFVDVIAVRTSPQISADPGKGPCLIMRSAFCHGPESGLPPPLFGRLRRRSFLAALKLILPRKRCSEDLVQAE